MQGHYQSLQEGYTSCFDIYQHAVEIAPADRISKFVEVGAWRGCSTAFMAELIQKSGKPIEFYVVDIWTGAGDRFLEPVVAGLESQTMFPTFIENLRPFWDVIRPVHLPSVSAARAFEYHSLDFVYIDALHTFDAVTQDMHAWFNRVKPGGILSGHDYSQHWPEVIRAVDEFAAVVKLDVDKRFIQNFNWMMTTKPAYQMPGSGSEVKSLNL